MITDLEKNKKKSAQNAANKTDLPKTLQMPSVCCFFHNLESQNAELVDVTKVLNKNKRSKGHFLRRRYY